MGSVLPGIRGLSGPPWQEGAEVKLNFDFGLGSFTLTADDIERVVME